MILSKFQGLLLTTTQTLITFSNNCKPESKNICFWIAIDGHVAKDLLRFKHPKIEFVFEEGKNNINEFDSIRLVV